MPSRIKIGLTHWADNVGVSEQRARQWAAEGRLPEIEKRGKNWYLPWDTKRPKPKKGGRKREREI